MSTVAAVLSLPTPLLLLVHLHILEYPRANNPEYDQDIFNTRKRGLRERTKTMEDVAYFLVGKIEGKAVKTVLSSYPCLQPAESLAFRTSLTKYLEGLRHQSIYPASARSSSTLKGSLKSSSAGTAEEAVAWWWRDVLVRKSLLEECSGNRFERVLLSLSTHALMKTSRPILPDSMSKLLRSQPSVYTAKLSQCQAVRHDWKHSASLMLHWEHELQALRDHIKSQGLLQSTTYSNVSTERLQALAQSKLEDLENAHWGGEHGRAALTHLTDLAGLRSSSSRSSSKPASFPINPPTSRPHALPSPLPVAAAHHPAHLKKLRRSVFDSKSPRNTTAPPANHQTHAEIVLAGYIYTRKQTRQALSDALSRTKKRGLELQTSATRQQLAGNGSTTRPFWTRPREATTPIDLQPEPSKELLASLGLELEYNMLTPSPDEDALEKRISEIRTCALPAYPLVPDPQAPRLPPREPAEARGAKSRIPLAKASSNANAKPAGGKEGGRSHSTLLAPLPQTPGMSPVSKSAASRSLRRKSLSVRFSMAQGGPGRPSMFGVFSGGLEGEVERLIDETHDFPTDDDDTDHESSSHSASATPHKTPRAKRKTPKVNRIWTAGTPRPLATANSRESVVLARLFDAEPDVGLPSLGSQESVGSALSGQESGQESDEDMKDGGNVQQGGEATPMPTKRRRSAHTAPAPEWEDSDEGDDEGNAPLRDDEDGDVFGDDPPSMTLKDILLSADTSHFDLLDEDDVELEGYMLVEDVSFVWE